MKVWAFGSCLRNVNVCAMPSYARDAPFELMEASLPWTHGVGDIENLHTATRKLYSVIPTNTPCFVTYVHPDIDRIISRDYVPDCDQMIVVGVERFLAGHSCRARTVTNVHDAETIFTRCDVGVVARHRD